MRSDEPAYGICPRVADTPSDQIALGSVQACCHDCAAPVWVHPDVQAVKHDAVICTPCFHRVLTAMAKLQAPPRGDHRSALH